MADELESVGGVAVIIGADYSKMMSDFQVAQGLAADAGNGISDALAQGAAGASELSDATAQLSGTLKENATASITAAEGGERVGSALKETTAGAREAESNVGALTEKLGELALELTAGLTILEFGKQMFEAAGQIQAATISLTALTGSAVGARDSIDHLKELAIEQGLSFPALLQANQRMVALGFSSSVTNEALQAAADAAAATNSDIGQLSDTMDRLALSGQVSSRFLATLGISTHELAEAMGVADAQVLATFHSLDTTTRLHVLTLAIEDIKNFKGLSAETADTIPRQWQSLKSTFEDFAASVGDQFSYLGGQLLTWFKNRVEDAQLLVNVLATAAEEIEYYATRAANFLEELTVRIVKGSEAADQLAAAHLKALQAMVAGFAEAEAKRLHLNEGVESTSKSLADLQKQFNADIATKNWDDANKIIAEMGKVSVPAAEEAMKRLIAAQQTGAGELTAGLVRAIKETRGELAFWIDEEKLEIAQQETVTKAIAAYGEAHLRAGDALSYAAAKQGYFAEQVQLAADKIEKELDKAPTLNKGLESLGLGTEKVGTQQKEFAAIMESVGIQVDKALPPLNAVGQAIAKIDHDIASGNLAQIESIIKRLAVDDLPVAVQQQERYIKALEDTHGSVQKLLAAQKELLTLEIEQAQERGQSTTKYQIDLALVDLHIKNMGFDTQHVFGTMIVGAINNVDKAFSQMGHAIAQTIVEGGNLGRTMHQIFTTLASDILGTVINAIVKVGEQFAIQKIEQVILAKAADKAEGEGTAATAEANTYASISAIPLVGPYLAPAAAALAFSDVSNMFTSFDTGGFVPADMLAMVHKGEFVIPAKDVGTAASSGALSPGGLSINIGNLHGVTRDTADHLAELIFRKARLAGAFR